MVIFPILFLFLQNQVSAQTPPSLNPQELSPILGRMQKAQSCNPNTLLRLSVSPYSLNETVNKVLHILNQKKLVIFSSTNYNQLNKPTNLSGLNQVMIMFGKPGDQPQKKPDISIQYPLRIMIWQSQNKIFIGYMQPSIVAQCYPKNIQSAVEAQQLDQLLANIVTEALATTPVNTEAK